MKLPLSILTLSSIMGMTTNSWMFLWLMIEFNTPMYSFLLSFTKENPKNPLNYFMFQSLASLLMMIMLISSTFKLPTLMSNSMTHSMMIIISMMKMGMIPFHNWILNMMKTLKKISMSTLLTIQKIMPLKISTMTPPSSIISFLIILNFLTASIFILHSLKYHHILFCSSTYNMSWILLNSFKTPKISMIFFLIYSSLTISLIMNLSLSKNTSSNILNKKTFPNLITSIISISGLPPMWGFMNKFMMTQSMFLSKIPTPLLLTLLISSVPMMTGYLKICSNMILQNLKNKIKINKSKMWFIMINLVAPSSIILI